MTIRNSADFRSLKAGRVSGFGMRHPNLRTVSQSARVRGRRFRRSHRLSSTLRIAGAEEGCYENGEWKARRQLSGDEIFFGSLRIPAEGTVVKVKLVKY